ncbi:MAG: SDR family NAD(P)-dependent oxidoreductase [Halomonadaceae bacterium]|nr:MAG: SDR family NAD(P)-dependent oxidoreductase [Halomonadaceae bacterium]
MSLKPLSEQTLVITGGSSGIGLAIARHAARAGAQVVLVARDEDTLKSICHDIAIRHDGRSDYVVADVGEREQVRHVVETVVSRHGGFDTWVNDAGVGVYARLDELSDEDHARLFQTNYWGVVYGATEALKHLRQRGGALINIGSISGEVPAPILSAYTATKHAVKGFTNSLRLEMIHDRAPVSVTLINPSGIHTPFGQHARNYMNKASRVPPPVYHPDLVAEAVLHAATHPVRDITVGGAGGLMIWLTRLLPSLADRLFAAMYYKAALANEPPRGGKSALYSAGGEGEVLGDQNSYVRHYSLYTHHQRSRALKAGCLAVAVGLVAMAAVKGAPRARAYLNHF